MASNNIYIIVFNTVFKQLLPPNKRKTIMIAFFKVLAKPLQWLRDLLFDTYADGFTGNIYSAVTTYNKGDRVRYIDRKVYECLENSVTGVAPPTDTDKWLEIQDLWIGLRERGKYNAQRMVLEYALNKWFDTTFAYAPSTSDIYIVNNTLALSAFWISDSDSASPSYCAAADLYSDFWIGDADYDPNTDHFTIYIPVAVYNALSSDPASRETIVRAFVDRYNTTGITYNVTTY